MTVSAQPERGTDRRVYHEPARGYLSVGVVLLVLLAGLGLDLALGGGSARLVGWLIAIGLVVGAAVLATRAARSSYAITVTSEELRAGADAIMRSEIVGVERDVDPSLRVLGHSPGRPLPRGVAGVAVRLADGSAVAVATRYPARLLRALDVPADMLEVRPATAEEIAALPEIERRADSLFRVNGMALPPDWSTVDELHEAKAVFVAGRPPVGFARIEEVDGLAHLEVLAVVPNRGRQGVGSALLEASCEWAGGRDYPAITLTTFADVAWNGPFYAARGFVEMDEITPELAELRDWERATGLDALGRRVAMRREL